MHELLTDRIFLPKNKSNTFVLLTIYWLAPLVIAVLPFLRSGNSVSSILTAGVIYVIMIAFMTLRLKMPVSITISTDTKMLYFKYWNCWHQIKVQTIHLSTASGDLRYITRKYYAGWRLLLYERWWFHNRLVLKEDEKAGFSKEQLDEIAKLIEQCKVT